MESTAAPKRFSEDRLEKQERAESVKPILAFFIDKHRIAFEGRLQSLVFYAEAIYYRENEERLTDVDWRGMMYGMYSSDVNRALDQFRDDGGEASRTVNNGKRTIAFEDPPDSWMSPETPHDFLEGVFEETSDIQTDELSQWTKDHPLFDATPYEETVDFTKLDEVTP